MEKMRIKSYAIKHKLSMFNVMKMVKSGKLVTHTEKIDGREVTYIVIDDTTEKEVERGIVNVSAPKRATMEEEIKRLKIELDILKNEISMLNKALSCSHK